MEKNSKDNQSAALQQLAQGEEDANRRTVGGDNTDQDSTANAMADGLATWEGPPRGRTDSSTSSSSEDTQDEETKKDPHSYLSTQWEFIEKHCQKEFQQTLQDTYPDIKLKSFWYEEVIPLEHGTHPPLTKEAREVTRMVIERMKRIKDGTPGCLAQALTEHLQGVELSLIHI